MNEPGLIPLDGGGRPAPGRRPTGLRREAVQLWQRLTEGVELTATQVTLLEQACRRVDQAVELERVVAREGRMSRGSQGQPKIHPAHLEAVRLRDSSLRLIRQAKLAPAEPQQSQRSWRRAMNHRRAVGAAEARWARE